MKTVRLLFFVLVLLSAGFTAQAEVPKLINYQGMLTTAEGGCVDTTFSMQFSIYSDSTNGDLLWTEAQPSVKVTKGIFNILLGSVDSIPDSVFTGDIRYLGVKVEDDSEMTPRIAIVSVGYAYRSSEADTAQYARTAAPDDDWQTDTSGFDIYRFIGNVGIGTIPQDSCKLFVQSDSIVGDYAVYARGGTGLRAIATAWEGTGIQGEGGHAGVAGNGYIGILGQGFWGGWFEGKGYFSGNVGIGTTEPDENLEVDGNAHITGNLTVDGSINSISLKVYDSGWFPVSIRNTYVKSHNLNTDKLLVGFYWATDANGSNMQKGEYEDGSGSLPHGMSIESITTTQMTLRTYEYWVVGHLHMGTTVFSGYARITAIALE